MAGNNGSHFGGHIKELFRDAASIEIWVSCDPGLKRGDMITVPKANFAEQSFRYGVGRGCYVEGVVYTDQATKAREFKHVTKIM